MSLNVFYDFVQENIFNNLLVPQMLSFIQAIVFDGDTKSKLIDQSPYSVKNFIAAMEWALQDQQHYIFNGDAANEKFKTLYTYNFYCTLVFMLIDDEDKFFLEAVEDKKEFLIAVKDYVEFKKTQTFHEIYEWPAKNKAIAYHDIMLLYSVGQI